MEKLLNKYKMLLAGLLNPDLKYRFISATLMFSLCFMILWLGNFFIRLLSLFLVFLLGFEWTKMCGITHRHHAALVIVMCTYASMLGMLLSHGVLGLGLLFLGAGLSIISGWLTWRRGFLWMGLGIFYVGIPFLSLMWITLSLQSSWLIILWVIVVVSSNDMGAYFIGKWLQGPKLCPSISPKKTWAGYVGGTLTAMLAAFILYKVSPMGWSLTNYLLTSLVIIQMATAGDLLESAIKRYHGVKDSGNIIPGHGGLFDRLDGFLLAFPFVAGMIYLNPQEFYMGV